MLLDDVAIVTYAVEHIGFSDVSLELSFCGVFHVDAKVIETHRGR